MSLKTENYYSDLTRISNSNIGWFLEKGPVFLHKMLTDPPKEEKNKVLERGTMIHEYLLQPEEFQRDYIVWNKSRPFSIQQEKFCQALAFSTEIEPNRAILSAFKEAYSTAGKSEDKMLSEGLKIASTLKDYIDFLKENDGRLMITPSEYKMLEKIKQNVLSHKLAEKLMWPLSTWGYEQDGTYTSGTVKAWHEFHINWEYEINSKVDPRTVHCKSLLDSLTIDFNNKIITIMDLKTTAKLWHFEDSIAMYDYLRQLMYYTMAVKWYLKNEIGLSELDISNFEFKYYIIGIDTTGSCEIRVFSIDQCDVESRKSTIKDALFEISWHQLNDKWEHSREYYKGDGSETLNL